MSYLSGNKFLKWVAVLAFHFALVFFSGILPSFRASANSRASFYNDPDKTLNACILQWNLNTIRQKWNLGITEAPIFFPTHHGKFFSEHLFGHLVFAYPISYFGLSTEKTYNLTYQMNRILIGVAASILCIEIGAALVPSLLSGGLMITLWKLGQLQNTGLCWALLSMVFLIRQMKNPSWGNVLGLALFLALTGLSSGYLAFYTPLALLFLLIVRFVYKREWPDRKWIAQMCAVVVLTSLALVPTMMNYRLVQKEYRLVRKGYTAARLNLPFQNRETTHGGGQEQISFHIVGLVTTIVAVFGFFFLLSKRPLPYDGWEWGFFILACLSFWMAFFEFSPYALIATLPGFNGLRGAYRWFFFFISSVTVLASLTLTNVSEDRRWLRFTLIVAAACLMISAMIPKGDEGPRERLPQSNVYAFLNTLSPGPVCLLPILPRGRLIFQVVNADRMLYQLAHSDPMVSGYSGFVPEVTRRIERTLIQGGVSDSTMMKLSKTGVRYVVLDRLLPDAYGIGNQLRSGKYKILYDREGEMIVELPANSLETNQNPMQLWSSSPRIRETLRE